MPFCTTGTQPGGADAELNDNGVRIFYRTYGQGPTKILLIIGLAGTHDSWGPQIKGLVGTDTPNYDETRTGDWNSDENERGSGIQICAFDNRGMGQSSVPTKKSEYTTKIMAKDAIAMLDHLGWKSAHVFGHSMGAMIACKLAAMVPERVLSLALLNVTGGGFECFPKEYLEEYVGPNTRRSILYQEYVRCISATGMQSNNGFEGQVNACWTHKMTRLEIERIHSAGFLVSVIHGRHDIIAQLYYARRLAEKLQPAARMIELHGGHLVSHERTEEVNQALLELIKASEVKINPHEWTNLPKKTSGWIGTRMALIRVNMEGGSNVSFPFYLLSKLHIFLLYLFGLFFMAFEYGRRALKGFKTVRVGPSLALPNGE
ncbi:putative aminoacrylate hydrolase RutD isoform X2 [Carya illinoinensis]|uniref:AB hydrolase-1 domain-containing protein n=1 Tax=Carya illinoinensis TaxID=32201 RepID=A0A8T1QMG9_CARIL|nr:putative aminoacrylate hydrolase RutD isoform X2 [Carya illinoinensis]KAG6655182.1 hypothetical protein CIPAW_05G198100 [Carya illinoinensis]